MKVPDVTNLRILRYILNSVQFSKCEQKKIENELCAIDCISCDIA